MQIIEKPYFKCDFCGKKQFRKSDMAKHEKWCKKKPENKHICFQHCVHLLQDREEIEDNGNTRRTFTCAVLGKKMYSFIAERRNIVHNLSDCERMPLECDKYRDKAESEFENAFSTPYI